MSIHPASTTLHHLQTLAGRALMLLERLPGPWRAGTSPAAPGDLALPLAVAALRWALQSNELAAEVAVIGPTQVGKSTVVNLLLVGAELAEVSPLAGSTVRPAAYQHVAEAASGADAAGLVIWDTPDFDSLGAPAYREQLCEIVARCGGLLLVVSREKYADLSVWRLLEIIEPLGRPLGIVLNKLPPDSADRILSALREKTQRLRRPPAAIAPLPHAPGGLSAERIPDTALAALRAALGEVAGRPERGTLLRGALTLVAANWERWTAPIQAAENAAAAWRRLVDEMAAQAQRLYIRDYLDQPTRFDPLRRITLELLTLLEIPTVAGAAQRVRWVLTWPARQAWRVGRQWVGAAPAAPPADVLVQQAVVRHVMSGLEREALRRASEGDAWWREIALLLQRDGLEVQRRFEQSAAEQQLAFDAQIRAAAQELLESLRKRPALLNSLRGARATADVASVVVAIKTGGLHLSDLWMAPALLAATSLLMESALGQMLEGVVERLRRRQERDFREMVLEGALASPLRELSSSVGQGALAAELAPEVHALSEALAVYGRGWSSTGGNP